MGNLDKNNNYNDIKTLEDLDRKEKDLVRKKIQELFNSIKIEKYELYSEKLEKEGLSEETEKLIFDGIIKILKNESVIISGKRIQFTEAFIYINIDTFIKNINIFLIFLMNIESYGGKNIENKYSSAKGPIQWIDGWKNGEKANVFDRLKGKTSPFETALVRADRFYTGNKYPSFTSNKIPKYIKDAWNDNGKLDLKKINTEKQIQIWFIDILMRGGKAKELLMGTMLGNTWSAKKLYENIHHTQSKIGSITNKVVMENIKLLNYLEKVDSKSYLALK